MQITPETLKQFADTTTEKYTRANFDIMAAYLRGSLVMGENPLLGNSTDIDLVFIHSGTPEVEREILPLTDDIHLDIVHHTQKEYLKGRELRIHPWMGPSLYNAQVLFDPQHFLDFTIATVRGMFYRADHIMMRVRPLMEAARQGWLELLDSSENGNYQSIEKYLHCIANAANALALLVGEPLTERKFLANFARRAERLDRMGMYAGILGLLGAPRVEVKEISDWVSLWESTFDSIPIDERPDHVHTYRRNYYLHGFNAVLESAQPKNVMWPLLNSWITIIQLIPTEEPTAMQCQEAFKQLRLFGNDLSEKLAGLEIYLEQAEDVIETWALENGA
jgi:hypothetical protein